MTETGSAPDEDVVDFEDIAVVDVEDFQSMLDHGEVGGDLNADPGDRIGVIDGEAVHYVVDTSPRVADVMGQGIGDPPFGEEV